MSIYSVSAEFATLSSDSVDLFEISDGRLKFRQGKSGIITAKFMVTQDNGWRKLRLTYRRPGKGLRLENYVIARLNQINRLTLATERLIFASSQFEMVDSDEIVSTLSFDAPPGLPDLAKNFYQIEIVMRRSPLLVPPDQVVVEATTLSGVFTLAGYEGKQTGTNKASKAKTTKTLPVSIPPPLESEIAAIESLRGFATLIEPKIGVLTPSPEFILVELATTAPGFG